VQRHAACSALCRGAGSALRAGAALCARARAAYAAGALEQARALFAEALTADPANGSILRDAAVVARDLGDYAAARSFLEQACVAAPEDPSVLTELGWCAAYSGELDRGKAACLQALKIDPDNFRGRLGLGYILLRQESFARSEKQLRRAARLMPHSAAAAYLRGRAAEGRAQYARGISFYRGALKKDYAFVEVREDIGRLEEAAGNRAAAL